MSSSYMVFRYFFSIINLCFFAFGLAVVICSWWLHLKSADYGALLANRWLTAPAIVIVSAKLAILLGAVGCLGAWFEKKAILFLYIFVMIILFVGLLLGVVFAIAFNEQRATSTRTDLVDRIRQPNTDDTKFLQAMDSIQRRLHCCGIDDSQDWFKPGTQPEQGSVPDSCCLEETHNCGKNISPEKSATLIYTEGCFDRIQMEINRNLMIVGILAFILVLIEGFCIVAALGLLCYLRQRDSYI